MAQNSNQQFLSALMGALGGTQRSPLQAVLQSKPTFNISPTGTSGYGVGYEKTHPEVMKKIMQGKQTTKDSPWYMDLIDKMMRGAYAVGSNLENSLDRVRRAAESDNFLKTWVQTAGEGDKAAIAGLTGKNKVLPSQALGVDEINNPLLRFGASLVTDVALDPLTYVGPGLVKGGLRAAGGGKLLESLRAAKPVDMAAIGEKVSPELANTAAAATSAAKAPTVMPELLEKLSSTARAGAWSTGGFNAAKAAARPLGFKVVPSIGKTTATSVPEIGSLLSFAHPGALKGLAAQAPRALSAAPKLSGAANALEDVIRVNPEAVVSAGSTGLRRGFLKNFATWFGQESLRPRTHAMQNLAVSGSVDRMRPFIRATKGMSDEAMDAAFTSVAKGGPDVAGSQAVADHLKSLFYTSGIGKLLKAGDAKSAAALGLINSRLTAANAGFQLQGKGLDALNAWAKIDLAAGGGAKAVLTNLTSAVEHASREAEMFGDLVKEFGSATAKAGKNIEIAHPLLKGAHFDPKMAQEISFMIKGIEDLYKPGSTMAKALNDLTNIWRVGVTKYIPSHHMRNAYGDLFLSYLAGVKSPASYKKGIAATKALEQLTKTNKGVELLHGKKALEKTGETFVKTRGGHELDMNQVLRLAKQQGIALPGKHVEDLSTAKGGAIQKLQAKGHLPGKAKGKASEGVLKLAEWREHSIRLTHFIDALQKAGGSLDEAVAAAGRQVRKWHPDGTDLTATEKKIRGYAIPFYSWTRKSLPIIVEGAITNPRVITHPTISSSHLADSLGLDVSPQEPLPGDQAFPSYLSAIGISPLGKSGMGGIAGLIGNTARQGTDPDTGQPIGGYAFLNPNTPLQDLVQTFTGRPGEGPRATINKFLGGLVGPGPSIPLEVLQGRDFATGAKITNPGQYATEQIPLVSNLARMTGVGPFGAYKPDQGAPLSPRKEAIFNFITALGLRGAGPGQAAAERELDAIFNKKNP